MSRGIPRPAALYGAGLAAAAAFLALAVLAACGPQSAGGGEAAPFTENGVADVTGEGLAFATPRK
ncbi:hypothetical protein ACTVZO_02965 [Streptomyces sp. IBSNAI002]|uniref:hypothetical protein n=1 Tax=Streptomyces sp. IBSNAI002 TaxID=3457500 RepID=UPI003FD0FB4C